jgi:arylsulfatase A-like enzyme
MKHERQKKKILGRNLGRDWTHYLLLIALLLVSPNFQSCTRGQKTEGNLFRIVDHFETLNFHETAIDSSVLMQGPKDAKTPLPSLLDPDLEKFIMENLNWDNTNGSPVHPFKLKIKKRPAKGSERGLRSKNAILAPPPTSFSFTRKISKNASLEFGYGIVNDNWENVIGEVSFTIDITDIKIQTKQRLFQTTLNPELRDMDKQWFAEEIDLGEYAKRNVTITFSTSSENAGTNNCYAAWVNPLLRTKENKQLKINVILISMDTLRADHLGCYGYTRDTTPNLDAISKESVLFKQVVAQAPYTVSSHMSMLTSLYPSFHKVNLIQESTMNPKINTLAEILYNNGYRTWAIVGGGQVSSDYGFSEGFETYIEFTSPHRDVWRKIQETINFIEKEKANNFFVFIHSYKPHAPYNPIPPYDTIFDPEYDGPVSGSIEQIEAINAGEIEVTPDDIGHLMALYDGDIREMDDQIVELYDYLKKEGLDRNTLVVFTSDHGEEFGEHGKVGVHSHTVYDELLLVPLILRLPQKLPPGTICEDQVQSIDILPTILDLTGISLKETAIYGESLLPLIKKRQEVTNRHAFSERLAADGNHYRSLRSPQFKYIMQDNKNKDIVDHFYFDLTNDPQEQNSLILAPDKLREMFDQIFFLVEEGKKVDIFQRGKKIDEDTLEILRALGYIK